MELKLEEIQRSISTLLHKNALIEKRGWTVCNKTLQKLALKQHPTSNNTKKTRTHKSNNVIMHPHIPQHLLPPLILYSLATENIGQICISQRFVLFEQCPPANLLFLLFICIDSPLQKCGQKRLPGVGIHHSPRHATSYPCTLHNFGDHRLHTDGERRFLDRRSCWPLHNFDEHRLRTHGDRRFIDRRSCWPMKNAALSTGDHVDLCIRSATTDYAHIKFTVSSTDDHVDLCITSTTTDYTHGERRFIDRRSCWPMENVALSTGDRVDLCIPSATTDYARIIGARCFKGCIAILVFCSLPLQPCINFSDCISN